MQPGSYKLPCIGSSQEIDKGGADRIRTCDTRFRKPMLYPLSYSPALCWQSWIVITTDSDELIVYYGPQTRKHAAKTHLSGMHRLLYTTGRVRLDVRLIPRSCLPVIRADLDGSRPRTWGTRSHSDACTDCIISFVSQSSRSSSCVLLDTILP